MLLLTVRQKKKAREIVLLNLNIPMIFCFLFFSSKRREGDYAEPVLGNAIFLTGTKGARCDDLLLQNCCHFIVTRAKVIPGRGKLEEIKWRRDPVQIVIWKVYRVLERWLPACRASLRCLLQRWPGIFTVHSCNCTRKISSPSAPRDISLQTLLCKCKFIRPSEIFKRDI